MRFVISITTQSAERYCATIKSSSLILFHIVSLFEFTSGSKMQLCKWMYCAVLIKSNELQAKHFQWIRWFHNTIEFATPPMWAKILLRLKFYASYDHKVLIVQSTLELCLLQQLHFCFVLKFMHIRQACLLEIRM